jgi:dolichol-phosphate mannosyltransferase
MKERMAELDSYPKHRPSRFGRAVIKGLDQMKGDAAVVMMADESDDCRDVVRYWLELNKGYDCIFGSRFIRGAVPSTIHDPS